MFQCPKHHFVSFCCILMCHLHQEYFLTLIVKKKKLWDGEISQWLKAVTTLQRSQVQFPSTYVEVLTPPITPAPGGDVTPSSCFSRYLYTCAHIHT